MVFNSVQFILFFFVVYGLYLALPHRAQNRMLLAASCVFYGSWDWRFLSLLLVSTVVDYGCAIRVDDASRPSTRRAWLLVSVAVNLGILGFFKYFGFFTENLAALLASMGFEPSSKVLDIVLPVGISFYTFQTMSYTLDVYGRKLPAHRGILDFALYVSFFPQLVAGPIERAQRLLPQVFNVRQVDRDQVTSACWLVLWGFFLKLFVADNLGPIVDGVFEGEGPGNGAMILLGLYAFAFQIFGDFAGYSSIAIGIAKLMGFDLMTNFRQPYFVTNPKDFWAHWHISLSTFLRDYLYIPLGGNRGSRWRTARNLMLTMVLGGLWHGAAWTFVVWGLFHGALLAGHRAWSRLRPPIPSPSLSWLRPIQIVAMFHVTCLGWLLFRASSLGQVGEFLTTLLAGPWSLSTPVRHVLSDVVFYTWPVIAMQASEARRDERHSMFRWPEPVRVGVAVLLVEAVLIWGAFGGKEFIYFQF